MSFHLYHKSLQWFPHLYNRKCFALIYQKLYPKRLFWKTPRKCGQSLAPFCLDLMHAFATEPGARGNQMRVQSDTMRNGPDGETGRRTGLKIPRGESSVTVRFRLR